MPFDVHKVKPETKKSLFTILRTASAEELAEYEKYKELTKKESAQNDDFELIKLGNNKTDDTVSIGNRDVKIKPERPAIKNNLSKRNFI